MTLHLGTDSCQIWDLFEGKHIFNERLPSREASSAAHLARMVALLGPPPTKLLQRGSMAGDFFDRHGEYTFRFIAMFEEKTKYFLHEVLRFLR